MLTYTDNTICYYAFLHAIQTVIKTSEPFVAWALEWLPELDSLLLKRMAERIIEADVTQYLGRGKERDAWLRLKQAIGEELERREKKNG